VIVFTQLQCCKKVLGIEVDGLNITRSRASLFCVLVQTPDWLPVGLLVVLHFKSAASLSTGFL
jgi:hypothetical protein